MNGLAFDDQYQVSIDTQQRALLYEAAAQFAAEHGVQLGKALSPELQALLDAPLLWYVEQQVPDPNCSAVSADCSGRFVTALVPTVYLPQLYREGNRNLAGGMIRGDEVTLQAAGSINNTGYLLAGNTLSVTAREFLNQKRQADFGKEFQAISGGWIDITGTRPISEGGVVAAADLQLNAERIQSISGEFQVLGRDAAETQAKSAAYLAGLRTVYGPQFQESVAKANLHYEVHQEKSDPFEQIAVAALGIGLSLWLGPQMSALVGEAFGATGGAFMGAAGTVQGVAVSAGVGNMVVAGTLTGMATSSATQLVATGSIDLGDAFQSGLTSGLKAGLTRGIGEAIGNETLLGGKLVDAGNGQTVVVATDGATSLADKIVGYTVRAATGAGVNQIVYGSSAGDAGTNFVNSLVSSASADAANWIGDNIDRQANPLGNIGAHALVGCAAAAASGNDCGAGALGAATAASLNPVLDQITIITDQATRDAQLAALSTAAAGFLAHATGNDIQTAIGAGQNETLNNYLTRSQKTQMLQEVASCDNLLCTAGAYSKYGVVSANQEVALLQGMGAGAIGEGYEIIDGIAQVAKDIPGTLKALREYFSSEDSIGRLTYETVQEYKQRLDRFERNYESGGFAGAYDAGVEFGRLIVDGIGFATTAGTTGKMAAQVGTKAIRLGDNVVIGRGVRSPGARISRDITTIENNFYRDGSAFNYTSRSADNVNYEMRLRDFQPAYQNGTEVLETVHLPGTKYEMVVSESQYRAIVNQGRPAFGGWATTEGVPNQAFARAELAITTEMKRDVSFVVQLEVTKPLPVRTGRVGPVGSSGGGGTQVEFLVDPGKRGDFLRVVGARALPAK